MTDVPLRSWGNPGNWTGAWDNQIRVDLHPDRATVLVSWTWTDPDQLRTAAQVLTAAAAALQQQHTHTTAGQTTLWEAQA